MQTKFNTLTMLLLILLLCSAAMASETFLVSSGDYKNIILQLYKLYQNQITLVGYKVITTDAYWGIFNTAIVHRKINNSRVFDVYFGECQDMECVDVTLSMKRLDSNFNIQFEKDDILPREYWPNVSGLSTTTLKQGTGTSYRILMGTGEIFSDRVLDSNGNPSAPKNIVFQGKYLSATSAKDGKMVVAGLNNILQIRTLHPTSRVTKVRISDYLFSFSLSDVITSPKIAKPYRLLLYRINRGSLEAPTRAIMMQNGWTMQAENLLETRGLLMALAKSNITTAARITNQLQSRQQATSFSSQNMTRRVTGNWCGVRYSIRRI